MVNIYVPARCPEDWRPLLAQPNKHWRTGYSANALAHAWMEQQTDFPSSVKRVFARSGIKIFRNISMLLAIPEYQTPIPGGRRASQSDIFVLAKSGSDLVSITVEGKVAEPFGQLVSEWIVDSSPGKQRRFRFLCDRLGLRPDDVNGIRYQLLHRTVSALIEADRFHASHALMMVHSFSPTDEWFENFAKFSAIFNVAAKHDSVVQARQLSNVVLYLAWVKGEEQYLHP